MTRARVAPRSVYTDGSSSPGTTAAVMLPGGWAYVTTLGKYVAGHEPEATNQRMELMAAIRAVEDLQLRDLRIHSDSAYVVNTMTNGWWRRWARDGWRTAAGKRVSNRDLWERMASAQHGRRLEFVHVKGHSGNYWNEVADKLCGAARVDGVGSHGVWEPEL